MLATRSAAADTASGGPCRCAAHQGWVVSTDPWTSSRLSWSSAAFSPIPVSGRRSTSRVAATAAGPPGGTGRAGAAPAMASSATVTRSRTDSELASMGLLLRRT
jgi:hypothetical protein